mmetsp:Transcript_6558/g.14249  ORF Transcript_6558/g.14249 Transcript_6558/m.14249 type:complete len:207 (+) Transcript_6558:650-1270(+)
MHDHSGPLEEIDGLLGLPWHQLRTPRDEGEGAAAVLHELVAGLQAAGEGGLAGCIFMVRVGFRIQQTSAARGMTFRCSSMQRSLEIDVSCVHLGTRGEQHVDDLRVSRTSSHMQRERLGLLLTDHLCVRPSVQQNGAAGGAAHAGCDVHRREAVLVPREMVRGRFQQAAREIRSLAAHREVQRRAAQIVGGLHIGTTLQEPLTDLL